MLDWRPPLSYRSVALPDSLTPISVTLQRCCVASLLDIPFGRCVCYNGGTSSHLYSVVGVNLPQTIPRCRYEKYRLLLADVKLLNSRRTGDILARSLTLRQPPQQARKRRRKGARRSNRLRLPQTKASDGIRIRIRISVVFGYPCLSSVKSVGGGESSHEHDAELGNLCCLDHGMPLSFTWHGCRESVFCFANSIAPRMPTRLVFAAFDGKSHICLQTRNWRRLYGSRMLCHPEDQLSFPLSQADMLLSFGIYVGCLLRVEVNSVRRHWDAVELKALLLSRKPVARLTHTCCKYCCIRHVWLAHW